MKKQLFIIVLLVGMLSVTYGFESAPTAATIGDKAPAFEVKNAHHTFALDSHKGHYTLVAFWTSKDAQSRITATEYSRWHQQSKNGNAVEYASINLDEDPVLYREIIRQDHLPNRTQFYAGAALAHNLRIVYGISDHYGVILIDPDGRIVAANPEKSTLEALNLTQS